MLLGSAMASGTFILEPHDIGSVRHRGRFQQLLTETTPVSPSYQSVAMQMQYRDKQLVSLPKDFSVGVLFM